MFAEIEVYVASRAAEEIFLQTRLNGVFGDLQQATRIALAYVALVGMGETFFSAAAIDQPERLYAHPEIRREAEALLRRAYLEVRALLERHRAAVIAVAEALIVRESLDSNEIEELIRQAETPSLDDIATSALADIPAPSASPSMVITARPATNGNNGHALDPERIVESQVASSLPPPSAPSAPSSTPNPATHDRPHHDWTPPDA